MARALTIAALYSLSFALLWFGASNAPAQGWPVTDLQVHACAAMILGCIAKAAGHLILISCQR